MIEIEFSQPTLELLDLIHNAKKNRETEPLRQYLIAKSNKFVYKQMVEKQILEYSEEDHKSIEGRYEEILRKLKDTPNDDLEKDNSKRQIAEFYAQTMDLENLETELKSLFKIDAGSNVRMDICLCKIRISIILGDRAMLIENIDSAKRICESGADWDRKNRFKVYLALYSLMKTDFSQSAQLFSECLASFEAEELLTFENTVLYLIFSSLLTFSRIDLEKKILNNSDVLKYNYCALADSIQKCDYRNLFTNLLGFIDLIKEDIFIGPFKEYFCKEIKIKGYSQFLLSYQTVHISKMAESFNVSIDHLENDLRNFIIENRIHCVIDKVDGIIKITSLKPDDGIEQELRYGDDILRNIRKYTS